MFKTTLRMTVFDYVLKMPLEDSGVDSKKIGYLVA